MCTCDACAGMDDSCCSLEKKTLFFSIWTIAHGILLTLCIFLVDVPGTSFVYKFGGYIIHYFFQALFLLHFLAGVILLLGTLQKSPIVILIGTILSSVMPYLFFVYLHLPIMQVILTIWACRYMNVELKK